MSVLFIFLLVSGISFSQLEIIEHEAMKAIYYTDTISAYRGEVIEIDYMTWMKENLDVTYFRNGDKIPKAQTKKKWVKAYINEEPAWCYPQDSAGRVIKNIGKFYNYYAVNDSRGLSPEGWYIPDFLEWRSFIFALGGPEMKNEYGVTPFSYLRDFSSSFNCTYSGYRDFKGDFIGNNEVVHFYADDDDISFAHWKNSFQNENSSRNINFRFIMGRNGYFVRCLK